MQKCKNCSRVCVYHCAQLSYTAQHEAVLSIFPLVLQTSTRVQMLSIGGEGVPGDEASHKERNMVHFEVKINIRQQHSLNSFYGNEFCKLLCQDSLIQT